MAYRQTSYKSWKADHCLLVNNNKMISCTITETSQFQIFCRVTWDTLLCWPPTRPGETVHLPCPPRQGIDPTRTYQKLDSFTFSTLPRFHPIFCSYPLVLCTERRLVKNGQTDVHTAIIAACNTYCMYKWHVWLMASAIMDPCRESRSKK